MSAKARRTLQAHPEIISLISEGLPLPLACRALGVTPALAEALRSLPEVDIAIALREADLRRRYERAETRDEREAAKTLLERDHAWRPVVAKSIEETFAAILKDFQEIEPEAYAKLRAIIDRDDSSSAQRRARHAKGD